MLACLGTFHSHNSKETIAIFMFTSHATYVPEALGGSMTCLHLHMGSQDSKYPKVHDIYEALGLRRKTL